MVKRIPQPPINPALRALENHDFWTGFVVVMIGVVLVLCGARHLTRVDTTDGDTASEIQLVKAFSSGGVQYASEIPPARPPNLDGVENPGEVLDRWAKQQANIQPPNWKIRVDAAAKTPCPT